MAASAVFCEEWPDGLFEVVPLRGGDGRVCGGLVCGFAGWLTGDLCGCGFVRRDGGEDAGCEEQRDTGEQKFGVMHHGFVAILPDGRAHACGYPTGLLRL